MQAPARELRAIDATHRMGLEPRLVRVISLGLQRWREPNRYGADMQAGGGIL